MVVDLSGGVDAESFPVYYYLSVVTLPYGGLASSIYRSSRIVLQRISGGTFVMGSGADVKEVTLTQDYYTGIFEITQEQWRRVMDGSPAKYTEVASRGYRPVECVSYNDIRGATTEVPTIDWPTSGSDVGADSFLDILRTKSAIAFDLPTEAQWEYACRAGTATAYHDGDLAATTLAPEHKTNQWLDVLGRYQYNGGYRLSSGRWGEPTAGQGSAVATAMAGSYLPNAWGLYDMHGNVWEWCLDWFDSELPGGTNPSGKDTSASGMRVCRGGGFADNPDSCMSASRTNLEPDTTQSDTGFRIVYALP